MRKFFKFITATVVSVISLIAVAFVLCNLRSVDLQNKADTLKIYCQRPYVPAIELHGLDKTNSNAKDQCM